ncbi:uncharacterized protein LOC108595813 [Drosophila busckii]|uniref:uncharacterized protein LOC108595813 n=1 Tax=Drosophila busckii TaxID=30019 RepID=UPI001432A30F|nr:uncharacterized protein LOC108595813 [Drosophila busckii]
MLPIEAPIESNAIFGRLSDMKTLLLLLLVIASAGGISLCQIDIYRRLPRCLHCLKLLPGLLLLLALCPPQAQYEALMVRRPRMKFLANFNDLLASNVRIKCLRSDFDGMGDAFRAKYADAFRLTDNLTEVHAMRGNFNTDWAYLIPTFNWIVLQSQQQYFQRPLFRYSDLCIFTFHQYSAIIAENSIYRRAFDQHIMRSQQSGLLMHWMRHSYYDMVASGHMQFKDLSVGNSRSQWPLALNDLRTLFSCYIACILLATLALLIELLYFYGKLCLNNL